MRGQNGGGNMEIDFKRTAELVVQIQNGDDSAFEELYHLTSKRAFFIAKEFVKNEDDAEDILQDSYIKALAKINELENPETFVSWFNRIVANKSKDYIKKKKPSLFECDEDEAYEVIADENTTFSPEENVDKEDLRKTVMQALDELSEDKKACIVMMYYEENSIGEIAECLEIPEGTVKTRLYHGRNELRRCFERAGVTSLYSAAPIGIIIWALRRSAQTAQASFAASPAYTSVLAGVKAAAVSTAAAATAAGTATAGTAAAAATVSSAATAAGGAVATGITTKVIAIAVAGAVVVGGGAVGAKVIHDKRAVETTTAANEESTEISNENIAVIVTEENTENTLEIDSSTITVSTENGTMSITVTPGVEPSTNGKPAGGSAASQPGTPQQTTKTESTTNTNTTATHTTTAKPTTTRPTTVRVTTTKPTATVKPTTPQAPTTTQPTTVGTATMVIEVCDSNWNTLKTINMAVDAGSYITANTIKTEVLKYVSEYGESYTGVMTIDEGEIISSAPGAQAGKTYSYVVVVS